MRKKPSYEELQQKVKASEKQILELKAAEAALRGNEQKYRDLYENAPVAYFSISRDDGSILRFNSEAVRLLGFKKETLAQMKVFDLYADTAHGVSQAKALFERFQAGESIRDEELQMKRMEEGKPIWVNLNVEPVERTDGEVVESRSTVIDISKRKQIEDALKKSEQRYRMLVETMNEGLAIIDGNSVFIYANRKLLEMLGYSEDEILGHQAPEFFGEASQIILNHHLAERKKGGREIYEIVWTTKDGRQIPTLISPQPLFDDAGHFKGSFAVITDITKLKQIEQALQKREKELETKTKELEEVNIALRVLLKRRDEDKTELEGKILLNVKELIEPYLDKLKKSKLDGSQISYLNILHANLNDIISPFANKLASQYLKLTPKEIQIAGLIKHGKTTKEIGDLLNLSPQTIESHRKNIRIKLGIKQNRANLRTRLLTLT